MAAARLHPSGFEPPSRGTVVNGFTLQYIEDFDRPVSEGVLSTNGTASPFDGVYGTAPGVDGITIRTYPSNYTDTSGDGRYDPAILSVQAGSSILRKHVHYAAGWPRVSAIIPRLGNLAGQGNDDQYVYGGRFEVVAKFPVLNTYKVAWLRWPKTNTRKTATGLDAGGEIDWPEMDLYGNDGVSGFMHFQGQMTSQPDSGQQYVNNSGIVTVGDGKWHNYALEWIPGTLQPDGIHSVDGTGLVAYYLDGALVGSVRTTNVPALKMRWVLQTETNLHGDPIDQLADDYIDIDWIAYYSYA